MRIVHEDGWRIARMRGSHRIYKHPDKSGIVVIVGNEGYDLHKGTYNNILKQAGLK